MNKGFTLVEILVAVVILSIGILAVSQMTIMGMNVNRVVNKRMYARVVLSQIYEELNNLPATSPFLLDDGDTTDLNISDTLTADHHRTITSPSGHYNYTATWNVADDFPEMDIKTVRIHILWGIQTRNHIHSDLMKRL